jgi:hypothetical protein
MYVTSKITQIRSAYLNADRVTGLLLVCTTDCGNTVSTSRHTASTETSKVGLLLFSLECNVTALQTGYVPDHRLENKTFTRSSGSFGIE